MNDILDEPFEEDIIDKREIIKEFGQIGWRSFKLTFYLLLALIFMIIISFLSLHYDSFLAPYIMCAAVVLFIGIPTFWIIGIWYSIKSMIHKEENNYKNKAILIISSVLIFPLIIYLSSTLQ